MLAFLFSFFLSLSSGHLALAMDNSQQSSDQQLYMYDESTGDVSAEQLDMNSLLFRPPPHVPIRPAPRPPGVWRPYPGWHTGWGWNRGWRPDWVIRAAVAGALIFPAWVWLSVPVGYWQCTAFNSSMQPFSQVGPDTNQAAYGALYACGGPNYQQMGCYIPPGYCQLR